KVPEEKDKEKEEKDDEKEDASENNHQKGENDVKDDIQQEEDNQENGKKERGKKRPAPIVIDLEGISERVLPFPVSEGRYSLVRGVKGRVFFLSRPAEGVDDESSHDVRGTIEYYD